MVSIWEGMGELHLHHRVKFTGMDLDSNYISQFKITDLLQYVFQKSTRQIGFAVCFSWVFKLLVQLSEVGILLQMAFLKLMVCNPHFKLLNAFNFIKNVLIQSLSTVIGIKNLLMGKPVQDLQKLLQKLRLT